MPRDLPDGIDDLTPEDMPEARRRLELLLENVPQVTALLYEEVRAIIKPKDYAS